MSARFFALLGRLAAQYRWPIIIGWLALAGLVTVLAPPLDQVTSSNTADLLPADAPFKQAETMLRQTFPDAQAKTSVAVVLESPNGAIREQSVQTFLARLTAWLSSKEASGSITEVVSPANASLLADALIARDNQAAIVLVYLSSDSQEPATEQFLARLDTYLKTNTPQGVHSFRTGMAPIVIAYSQATTTSVDRTAGITVVLVVLILLLVYRSPVSPLVPLLTVTVSYLISRGLIAWVGRSGVTISSYIGVFLVVVLFGAGTDYCLFLISRFREEMADEADPSTSTRRTVYKVGETLVSSAGTVIVGFITMVFSEMGLFRNSGPVLALAIVVVLLAGLTLTPALLSLLGQRAFWPGRASHRSTGRYYGRIAALVSEHPLRTIVIIVIVLSPLALYSTGQRTTYDLLADLPTDYEASLGYRVIENHLGAGQMQPLNVVVRDLKPENALAEVEDWTSKIRSVPGVADVRSLSNPLGTANSRLQALTRVDRQLALAADVIAQLRTGEKKIDPAQLTLAMNALPFIRDYLDTLAQKFPQVAANEDLAAIRRTLDGLTVATLTGQLDQSLERLQQHVNGLAQAFASIDNAYYLPAALPQPLVGSLGGSDPLALLNARYLKADRTAARFEVILTSNPFSPAAMDSVSALRALLPGGEAAISGSSATMTDLRATMSRDLLRAFAFVLLGVLLVLIFLLRALVSPLYLILTILLSYGATMGITRLASGVIFGAEELTWWVPFFMFVLLVALGMDYNIFLMGRVREEVARCGLRLGVQQAVTATGAIITSAGIIMAGTFAAMLFSVVVGLRQLGLAVAVGVLLDTFVIRTALVPAIAVLLDHWNWWPGRPPRAESPLIDKPIW